jgi:two-component system NtrC family sensor kinase
MLADNREAAYEVMNTIALKQGIDRIRMFNRDGRVMFTTRPEEGGRQVDKDAEVCTVCHSTTEPRVHVDTPSRVRIRDGPGPRILSMVTPIYNEPACSQAACHAHPAGMKVLGVLDVAMKLDWVDREIAGVQFRSAVATGVEILLVALFIRFFTRHFLGRPVAQLIEGAKSVAEMNLDQPIVVRTDSEEIGQLARSFEAMRERLRHAMAEINQFTQNLESKVEERTEQLKAAHQKLMQSDRLASLGQLSASVAHEINNPISGVLNLSMLMQRILTEDGIPKERIPEFRKYLGQIVSETSRVGRIVSDLLSFSRRSKPQRAPADLNRIVRTTLSLVSHKLKLSNVETELDLDPGLPLISCDSSQIQQVVLNLVMNAAEATQTRRAGRILLTTRRDGRDSQVILSIADDGEGIPSENVAKIFDPFFTTKPEGKGVGLGLAVLYGIVEAHGGEVSVKSRTGEGTTFIVTLPLESAEPVEVVLPTPGLGAGAS